MKLNDILSGQLNAAEWEAKGYELPKFDIVKLREKTAKEPTWVHFGGGNIFRAFPAAILNDALNTGKYDRGVIVAETFDFEVIDKAYAPYNNLSLCVNLCSDGSIEKKVIASVTEALKADPQFEDWNRLVEIFKNPSLQMISFTITEKGYTYNEADLARGLKPVFAMGKVCALLLERFNAGQLPLTVQSMDNCSHNGDTLITYGIQILVSILMISMIMVMMLMSVECVRRISEVLTEEPAIKNPENPIYEVKSGDIIFDNVNFKYKETAQKCALSNINLEIKSGEFVGIIGSTGSGKTSLVNLISRLYDVTEGKILVGGEDVHDYDIPTLRKSVSVVLQKNVLFSGTIASNLRWGKEDASIEELEKACEIAQASEIVKAKKDGLDTKVEQGGANFSGGQKQRLCIARAIVGSPKILILDDSTSAVDTKTDKLIRKGLKEKLPKITKIVIAQRISSIEDADKIVVMDDGKISAIGTHKELMKTSKIYREVYETQNRVGGEK